MGFVFGQVVVYFTSSFSCEPCWMLVQRLGCGCKGCGCGTWTWFPGLHERAGRAVHGDAVRAFRQPCASGHCQYGHSGLAHRRHLGAGIAALLSPSLPSCEPQLVLGSRAVIGCRHFERESLVECMGAHRRAQRLGHEAARRPRPSRVDMRRGLHVRLIIFAARRFGVGRRCGWLFSRPQREMPPVGGLHYCCWPPR